MPGLRSERGLELRSCARIRVRERVRVKVRVEVQVQVEINSPVPTPSNAESRRSQCRTQESRWVRQPDPMPRKREEHGTPPPLLPSYAVVRSERQCQRLRPPCSSELCVPLPRAFCFGGMPVPLLRCAMPGLAPASSHDSQEPL